MLQSEFVSLSFTVWAVDLVTTRSEYQNVPQSLNQVYEILCNCDYIKLITF